MQLRPYQQACVEAVYDHLRTRDDNPCAVIPTAGGKTPVMATICRDAVLRWDGRVLVLAHVKELLEQSADKLRAVCPELRFGLYSAGLNRRDTDHAVIVAGIQSVAKRAAELGVFDLILIDEAHMLPPDGEGQYRQFLAEAAAINPHIRVVGFTATPFRMRSGPICTTDGILNHVCFEVGVRELIQEGYLCPLVSKGAAKPTDFSGLHVRAGEFIPDEVERLMNDDQVVAAACTELVAYAANRQAVLVFASGVDHGRHVVRVLSERHGVACGFVTGATPRGERDDLLARFRDGNLKYLCNVNVLTTGFDAPRIDCVALMRPTMSPGLFYQMAGRGFRLHPGKQDCLVLDFGGNVLRHGPVDDLQVVRTRGEGGGVTPAKQCPGCQSLIAAGYATCPDCGHDFPEPEKKHHAATAAQAGMVTGQVTEIEYEVRDIRYRVHAKRGAPPDAPKSMRVEYQLGFDHWQYEFICVEHDGYARQKAAAWWRQRSPDPVPTTAERAVEIAEGGGLAITEQVTVRNVAGEKYDRIVAHKLGPMPEPVGAGSTYPFDPDDIPF